MVDPDSGILRVLNLIQMPFFVVSYPDFRYILSNSANNREFISPFLAGALDVGRIVGKSLDEIYPEPLLSAFKNIFHKAAQDKVVTRHYRDFADYPGIAGRYELVLAPVATEESHTSSITGLALRLPDQGHFSDFYGKSGPLPEYRTDQAVENERLALIGQLTLGIAHEIKNPLTVISGFAEVTRGKLSKISGNEMLKESIAYYQQEIIDNCRSMNRLIVDLLQLARPRNNERVRVNMAVFLEKICSIVAPYALQRNITLIKDLLAADIEMSIDVIKIRQVLLNLCNNAVQSMSGAGILGITTARDDGHLVISVTDSGCGIRPEDISRLGTPFYTTKAEGTGLGLSVTYSIIQDHGGRIEVDSEFGKGTTFSVYLPVNGIAAGSL